MPSAPIAHDECTAKTARLHQLLLTLCLLGTLGLLAELFLLEHTESTTQYIPFSVLLPGLAVTCLALARPRPGVIRLFRYVMVSYALAGLIGVVLHFRGNVEFELEMYPELTGIALVWKALRGATPALAPGALAQLGLLGLCATFRHPLLPTRRTATPTTGRSAGARTNNIAASK